MTSKPIYMLRRGQCRFPVTPDEAPSHLFCAEPVEREGVVYCAEHAARCYDRRPVEKRRADADRAAVARLARDSKRQSYFKGKMGTAASAITKAGLIKETLA